VFSLRFLAQEAARTIRKGRRTKKGTGRKAHQTHGREE